MSNSTRGKNKVIQDILLCKTFTFTILPRIKNAVSDREYKRVTQAIGDRGKEGGLVGKDMLTESKCGCGKGNFYVLLNGGFFVDII